MKQEIIDFEINDKGIIIVPSGIFFLDESEIVIRSYRAPHKEEEKEEEAKE